jgi:hypothetical protein
MPSKVIVTIAFIIILVLHICPTIVISKLSLLGDSIVIGGKFNQPTAKAIDFCWSFGIAPLLYWALVAYFFSISRVTMVNKQSKHATSLQSLAEASGTDSGTYNYFKLHRLLFRSTQRMKLFAVGRMLSDWRRDSFERYRIRSNHNPRWFIQNSSSAALPQLGSSNSLGHIATGKFRLFGSSTTTKL